MFMAFETLKQLIRPYKASFLLSGQNIHTQLSLSLR